MYFWEAKLHVNCENGFITTWILQQIFMLINKVKHVAGWNNVPIPNLTPYPITSPPTGWTSWALNDRGISNRNCQLSSHDIISTYICTTSIIVNIWIVILFWSQQFYFYVTFYVEKDFVIIFKKKTIKKTKFKTNNFF